MWRGGGEAGGVGGGEGAEKPDGAPHGFGGDAEYGRWLSGSIAWCELLAVRGEMRMVAGDG